MSGARGFGRAERNLGRLRQCWVVWAEVTGSLCFFIDWTVGTWKISMVIILGRIVVNVCTKSKFDRMGSYKPSSILKLGPITIIILFFHIPKPIDIHPLNIDLIHPNLRGTAATGNLRPALRLFQLPTDRAIIRHLYWLRQKEGLGICHHILVRSTKIAVIFIFHWS